MSAHLDKKCRLCNFNAGTATGRISREKGTGRTQTDEGWWINDQTEGDAWAIYVLACKTATSDDEETFDETFSAICDAKTPAAAHKLSSAIRAKDGKKPLKAPK